MSALGARAHDLASQEGCDGEPYDTLQECADALGLLPECAEALRELVDLCAECDYGDGATGLTEDGQECLVCGEQRALLKRIEEVL